MSTILKFKKLRPDAIVPTKGTEHSAAWDLYLPKNKKNKVHMWRNDPKCVGLGFAMEIPVGYYGLIAIRSSLGKQGIILTNGVGIVDSDYRGEWKLLVTNIGQVERILMPGDRVAQLILRKLEDCTIEEVDDLSDTARGTGGFGSTGK